MQLLTNVVNFIYLVRGLILFVLIPFASIIILLQGFDTWRKTRSWSSVFSAMETGLILLAILVVAFSLTSMYDFIRSTEFGKTLPDLTTLNK